MSKTKRRIRKAFQNVTPNVLSAVLSQTNMENNRKDKKLRWKEYLATAAAVVLLFGVGYGAAGILGSIEITGGAASSKYIGAETAKGIATGDALSIEKRDVLKVTDIRAKLVKTDEDVYYDVVLSLDGIKYDYDIDADSGLIQSIRVDKERGTMLSGYLSWQSARDAALEHAGVAIEMLTQFVIEFDADECTYGIGFRNQIYAYEYEIDGYNGNVLQLDVALDDDADPVMSAYRPRQYSVEAALKYAGVSYEELTLLNSSTDYESSPKIRTVIFETSETQYFYELYMDSHTIKSAEQYTPDVKLITWQAARTQALKRSGLPLDLVSDLSFELKDWYGQISAEKSPVYVLTFTAYRDKYEVTVDGLTGNVLNIAKESNTVQDYGSDIALPYLCANAAIEAAGVAKKDVDSLSTEFDTRGKFYKVKFTTESRSYTFSIDGKTRAVLSYAPSFIISVPDKQIGSERAIEAALDELGILRSDVMYESVNLESEDGTWYYEVSFWHDGFLYECKVNVVSGEVLSSDKEESDPEKVDLSLTEDDSRAIRKEFLETFVPENERESYTIDDLSIRYFGRYDDAMVLFVDGILGYDTAITFETYGGVEFRYPTNQHLLVYHEDKLMTLAEAYDEGVLDYEDIVLLSHHYSAE